MNSKVAACHCGKLQLTCAGEPLFVAMCHCQACQRRTGSSYGLAAWYPLVDVTIEGTKKVFRRIGEAGNVISFHFCPECGSNVYWSAAGMETAIGIAGGCFADFEFPQPTFSVYEDYQHEWLSTPDGTPRHSGSYPGKPLSPDHAAD